MRSFLIDAYNRALRYADWNIGIVKERIQAFVRSDTKPEVHWLPRPRAGRYLADPFAVVRDGIVYVLCEEFDYSSRKGVISCIELPEDAPPLPPRTVLDLPFHVSYPYLVPYRGEVYCVPETAQALEVGLYKAEEFPNRWNKVTILVEGVSALDNTVFHHEGRWWLTFFLKEGQNPGLYAWHATDPLGSWQPHARNPVKTDYRSSRPGGTPFEMDGSLYRPAQDSSNVYGERILINRVQRLSPTEFEEETVAAVAPLRDGPYPDGLHTISAAGGITLVDGLRLTFVRSALTHSSRDPLVARWMKGIVEEWWPRVRSSIRG